MKAVLLLFIISFSFQTLAAPANKESGKEPLKLGFFPIISTVALYKRFSPLRDYLSESMGRKVVLLTAKDFPTFIRRTTERHYDIVVTAPHFAVSAADSGKYRIRATLVKDVQQLIVVKSDSTITAIDQLKGKNISTPPVPALMTMMGKNFLEKAGLKGDKAPTYRAFTSHNAANKALLGGEVDAAIASSNIVKKAIKQGEGLKILSHGLNLPNMATMVATDKDALIGDQLIQVLTNMKKTKRGKDTLKKIKFPGYRAVSANDYEIARPYMESVRAMSKK